MSDVSTIALVLDRAGQGGTERHVRSLVTELPERGFEVHLVTSEDGPLVEVARANGVSVHILRRYPVIRYVATLARELRRIRPHVVHTHSGRAACVAARLARVPLVIETRHGLGVGSHPHPRLDGWKSRLLADETIAVCGPDALWLKRSAQLPEARVRLIPNGVPLRGSSGDSRMDGDHHGMAEKRALIGSGADSPVKPCGESTKVLGFIGRLVPEKAPERVLELLSELSSGEDWRAVICGDGPLRPALEVAARTRDLAGRVVWTGAIASADSILAAVDLLCLPSVTEGLPYVLLEALSAGVPILATPVGGIEEVLAGPILSDGCVSWDRGEWAKRARNLTNPVARGAWRTAARQRAASYSQAAMVDAVTGVYRAGLLRLASPNGG